MLPYKGKAKCGFCGKEPKRAKWRSSSRLACEEHKNRIEGDQNPVEDSDRMTDADEQTWARL